MAASTRTRRASNAKAAVSKGRKKAVAKTAASRSGCGPSRVPKDTEGLPRMIFAQASPLSIGGRSLFTFAALTRVQAPDVVSEPGLVIAAAAQLQTAGFTVLRMSSTTINIAGPADLYRSAFACSLTPEERPVIKEQGREDTASFVECPDTDLPGLIDTAGTPFADLLEGVALEEPRYFMAASSFPPPVAYWHLDVPGDVSLGCNADQAHRGLTTGAGVKVVMVDSGQFLHPYFPARGYRVNPVVLGPGATDPEADENGHGTAESANVFALAPDVDFTMVKTNFVNTIGSFNAAVELGPQIISCSWGSDKRNPPLSAADNALAAAVAVAVASGIVVVFSAGNGHYGFPGQHPDVISAGGVYLDQTGALQASDYSSGFASNIYPGRNVPDLSGLVGMRPRAAYIMLPLEPGDEIDLDLGNGQPIPTVTRPSPTTAGARSAVRRLRRLNLPAQPPWSGRPVPASAQLRCATS